MNMRTMRLKSVVLIKQMTYFILLMLLQLFLIPITSIVFCFLHFCSCKCTLPLFLWILKLKLKLLEMHLSIHNTYTHMLVHKVEIVRIHFMYIPVYVHKKENEYFNFYSVQIKHITEIVLSSLHALSSIILFN